MAGRNALATPTNVYPRNGNVVIFSTGSGSFGAPGASSDPNPPATEPSGDDLFPISFTCQSDAMAFYGITIYDATTGQTIRSLTVRTYAWQDYSPYVYHRGDTVHSNIRREAFDDPNQTLYTGYHYSYKLTMYSCIPDTTGQYQSIPNCIVPYSSGIVQNTVNPENGSSVLYIQNGIPKLRSPSYWSATGEIIGCTYMRIGHEERMVTSYNKSTGEVIVDSAFPSSVLQGDNIQYYLYCNFIESSGSESEGSYDFYIRDPIESTLTAKAVPVGLQCKASYSQGNNVGLESYRFKVYTESGNNYVNGQVQETTSAIENQIDNSHIPIATNLSDSITGKKIRFAESPTATFIDNIVTTGDYSTILSYDPTTGIVTLKTPLASIPVETTLYSICLDNSELIADSGDIFNYHMIYNLPVKAIGESFNVETILTTYEKQQLRKSDRIYFPIPTRNSLITNHNTILDTNNQRVIFTFTESASQPYPYFRNIYRREQGEVTWKKLGILENSVLFKDYLAGNNRTYEYMVTEALNNSDGYNTYDPTANYAPYTGTNIKPFRVTTAWDGWTITSIYPYKRGMSETVTELLCEEDKFWLQQYYMQIPYYVGETWHFISAIDSGNILSNLNRTVHIGTSKYPTVVGTNNKYQSGTFTTNLLSIECPDGSIYDNIEKVNRWLKFINDDCLFILKSDKGDVWIVAISDNTSRTYDESVDPILTNVSYSWVEVESPDKIQIVEQFGT